MEDHHVDRPGVQAQQCVELTGTNSSIGLIASHDPCAAAQRWIIRSSKLASDAGADIRPLRLSAERSAARGRALRCARANDERSELQTIHASPQTSGSLTLPPFTGRARPKPAQSAGKAERPSRSCAEKPKARMRRRRLSLTNRSSLLRKLVFCRPGGWSEEHKTRSHLELGR